MDDTPTVQTTETSLEIINALKSLDGATLSQTARELDISKSTARTHLQTLRKHGYVVMDSDDIFRLSLEFLDTGERVRSRIPIYKSSIPIVDEIAEKTNEKSQIMVLENSRGYYIYRTKGQQGVSTRTGRQAELHCTSAGKAILAHTDRDDVREILDKRGLPKRTDQTITDRTEFMNRLDEVQERGIAFNDEERLRGLRAVGAPILDDDNNVLGAISLSGPTTRLRGERFREELPSLIMQSADVINIRTQYS